MSFPDDWIKSYYDLNALIEISYWRSHTAQLILASVAGGFFLSEGASGRNFRGKIPHHNPLNRFAATLLARTEKNGPAT